MDANHHKYTWYDEPHAICLFVLWNHPYFFSCGPITWSAVEPCFAKYIPYLTQYAVHDLALFTRETNEKHNHQETITINTYLTRNRRRQNTASSVGCYAAKESSQTNLMANANAKYIYPCWGRVSGSTIHEWWVQLSRKNVCIGARTVLYICIIDDRIAISINIFPRAYLFGF